MLDPVKRFVLATMPESALMPLKKAYYGRLFRKSDSLQDPDLLAMSQLVRPGDFVVDVGANIGVYTRRLSQLAGSPGKVVSIEPVPSTFSILQNNVRHLRLNNVRCLNLAVSDHAGFVRMEVPTGEAGWVNIYRAHISDTAGGNIRAVTLDEVLSDAERVNFIKCDVEGHEQAVLNGARALIQRCHPAWLIEIDGDPDQKNSKAWQTFQLMFAFGYRPFIADSSASLCPREPGMTAINYFFL